MNKNKKTYIGVTIGPIFKTIQTAKHTGELWASSYMFSYIMKNIIRNLLEKYENENIVNRFVIPYVGGGYKDNIFKQKYKAGIFHDRFIFQSRQGEFDEVNYIIRENKKTFANEVYKSINNYYENRRKYKNEDNKKFINQLEVIFKNNTSEIQEEIEKYIEEYLKIYSIEVEIDESQNVIDEISRCLDVIELNENFINHEKYNYLSWFLKNDIIKESFLSQDGFEEKEKFKKYPDIESIAAREINDNENFNKLKEKIESYCKNSRRKIHKYACIVQADGDNIGNVISKLKSNEVEQNKTKNELTFKDFSEALYKYAKNSVDIINEYGGLTLYAGGDDLLFIAPVINTLSENRCKNIFDLIDELSDKFSDKFRNFYKNEENGDKLCKPTLSFGISIIYYKYPLYEGLEDARMLLFENAKNFSCYLKNEEENVINAKKNAIAFRVIHHSGQYYELTLSKYQKSYEKFKKILNDEMKFLNDNDKNEGLINNLKSISNRIFKESAILNSIGNNKEKLKNYFINSFNEEYHKNENVIKVMNNIIDLIHHIYLECELEIKYENIKKDTMKINEEFEKKEVVNKIYPYLKFIKFLGEKDKNEK